MFNEMVRGMVIDASLNGKVSKMFYNAANNVRITITAEKVEGEFDAIKAAQDCVDHEANSPAKA